MKPGIILIGVIFIMTNIYSSELASYMKPIFKMDKLVVTTKVNASAEEIYNYLGNSEHASEWSSFVSHITPLNLEYKEDGMVGSERRCFKNNNEAGEVWDEIILEAQFPKRRLLQIYNLQNFPLSTDHLLTEQIYEEMDTDVTKLSFSLYLDEKADWLDHVKLYYASSTIQSVFKINLENIKQINESKYSS